MPMSLTQSQIEEKLTNKVLDELLHLWWTEPQRSAVTWTSWPLQFLFRRTRLFGSGFVLRSW
jgi:hypothetical protein